ncbi:hypothetical protein ACFFRR_011663 [Megaselia abdita]
MSLGVFLITEHCTQQEDKEDRNRTNWYGNFFENHKKRERFYCSTTDSSHSSQYATREECEECLSHFYPAFKEDGPATPGEMSGHLRRMFREVTKGGKLKYIEY